MFKVQCGNVLIPPSHFIIPNCIYETDTTLGKANHKSVNNNILYSYFLNMSFLIKMRLGKCDSYERGNKIIRSMFVVHQQLSHFKFLWLKNSCLQKVQKFSILAR
jgi:hypothetical protein